MSDLVLGESVEVLLDHRGKTPRKLGADFTVTGVPVVSAMLVSNGMLDLNGVRFVSEETHRKWMPAPTKAGDVLLTSEAPLGRVAIVPNDEPLVLGQRLFCLRGSKGVLDSRYLFYSLQTKAVQADLLGRATGTTVVGIRQAALRRVRIPAPPFHDQCAIAEVLGALDDKIAANARLNSTIDALSLSLWEKLDSEATGSAQSVAEIITTAVAGDWGVTVPTPTEVCDVLCVRGADVADLQFFGQGNMPNRFIKAASLAKRQLAAGDVVVEMSGGSPTQSTGRAIYVGQSLLRRFDRPIVSSNFCRRVRTAPGLSVYFIT